MKPEGLTTAQAQKLFLTYGQNELTQTSKVTPLSMFAGQFSSILVWLLVAAAGLSFVLGDSLDGVLILLIVVLNAILGFVQEFKAEKALAALKRMTVSLVRVIRDGTVTELDNTQLVPGDVILLDEGDKIPADAKIVESHHLEINEASFTGESLPVPKDAKTDNMVFMGTIVSRGRATALVIATGMRTKFGAIASQLGHMQDEETPLEKKMAVLGRQLGIVALGAAGIIFGLGFFRNDPLFESIITAISLAVAAVPEGLPAVVTITLAIGTQRMARQRSILRKLSAIESLGSVSVIATDKTGTITQNDMRVTKVWTKSKSAKSELVRIGVLCNNANLATHQEYTHVVGDKTEGSLLLYAKDMYPRMLNLKQTGVLLEEFAFHAELKRMSVVWKDDGKTEVLTKGAPEYILGKCTTILGTQGKVALTQERRAQVERAFQGFAKEGLRLIAMAKRQIAWERQTRPEVEDNLTFVGFVGISDPARPEVKDAVALAQKAGILTIMITGDNELTAASIAQEVGLIEKGEDVITGPQFATLTDEQARHVLSDVKIFARTTPEQKLRIVKLLQQMGHVVAVTGDGVNDALALKQADVGVAMGIMGTDVAKEASDMIITDDNYASLVVAVEEGRTIFDNIKSATKYLIGCNVGEIIAITGGVLLGWPFVVTPLQILYINLVTDGLPAIALSMTPKQRDIMKNTPRTERTIFGIHDLLWFVEVSVLTGIVTLIAFSLGWGKDVILARTLAFTALILAQQYIFYDVAGRNYSVARMSFVRFPWLFVSVAILVGQVLLLYLPAVHPIFKITTPDISHLAIVVAATTVLLLVSEFRKHFGRHLYSHH